MMHKKYILQETKEINNRNAKVTVQYIQNQQLFRKQYDTSNERDLEQEAGQDDLEIENVEYLEDNANVEEYIEEPGDKDEFEDNFYPNAIYCLLDLYKNKYNSLCAQTADFKVAQIWRDIAKDMQESFFDFSERQIQHKYSLLRKQYFAVHTKDDIDNFDYFEQLHDIYKDPCRDNIAKGLNSAKCNSLYYKDEILLQSPNCDISEEHIHNFKNKEIVHKEHEFIDMVEKELQAMEDGLQLDDKEESSIALNETKDLKTITEEPVTNVKRARLHSERSEEPLRRKIKTTDYVEYNEIMQEPCSSSTEINKDFSWYQYNQEQERRHREKISLIYKSLQIQERALEQQKELLHELIKRLPS